MTAITSYPETNRKTELQKEQTSAAEGRSKVESTENTAAADSRITFINGLLEKLLGRKTSITDAQKIDPRALPAQLNQLSKMFDTSDLAEGSGELAQSYYQYDQTTISAEGTIKTRDGQEISFSLQLSVSHELAAASDFAYQNGENGPMSVSFDGFASELTSTQFSFALASDDPSALDSLKDLGKGLFLLLGKGSKSLTAGSSDLSAAGLSQLAASSFDIDYSISQTSIRAASLYASSTAQAETPQVDQAA